MKTQIPVIKKVQKLVTNGVLLLLILFSTKILAQKNDITNVFENTVSDFKWNDSIVCTLDNFDIKNIKSRLEDYCDYRIKGRPFLTSLIPDKNDNPVIDSLWQEQMMKVWKKKYHKLDSLFTIEDIRKIQDNELTDNVDKVYNTIKSSVKWCTDCDCVNKMSQPFFNTVQNTLFIIHKEDLDIVSTKWTAYIFIKSKNKWILDSKINNFGI